MACFTREGLSRVFSRYRTSYFVALLLAVPESALCRSVMIAPATCLWLGACGVGPVADAVRDGCASTLIARTRVLVVQRRSGAPSSRVMVSLGFGKVTAIAFFCRHMIADAFAEV